MGVVETYMKGLPSKDIPLSWEPLVLTKDKIKYLWDQVRQFPILFDDFGRDNFDDFVAKLLSPKNVFVDIGPGVGLGCGFGVRPGLDALLHIVMFDRRLKGREPLFKEILAYYFDRLRLRRLTATIPEDANLAVALAKRMGFKHEGTMREALLRNGKYLDVHIYGILKEELDAPEPHAA